MKLYVIEYYVDSNLQEKDWDVAVGETEEEAVKVIRTMFKEEHGYSDKHIEGMEFEGYPIPDCCGYYITLAKKVSVPYNQRDHSHCPIENSPCGIEGGHRCCLCEMPLEVKE